MACLFTSAERPVPEFVVAIRLVGIEPKILQSVVAGVAVVVTANHALGTRPDERFHYQPVNSPCRLLPVPLSQVYGLISKPFDRFQRSPGVG
jgi:hypothetical protein